MTEQEAAALAARLTRIWAPSSCARFELYRCSPEWGVITNEFGFRFDYETLLSENITFEYLIDTVLRAKHLFTISITRTEQEKRTGSVGYHGYHHRFFDTWRFQDEYFQEFSSHWMPFFRRGLWLSGFPIEASAHEKAEWMQGFSREEIEAWNLKI